MFIALSAFGPFSCMRNPSSTSVQHLAVAYHSPGARHGDPSGTQHARVNSHIQRIYTFVAFSTLITSLLLFHIPVGRFVLSLS